MPTPDKKLVPAALKPFVFVTLALLAVGLIAFPAYEKALPQLGIRSFQPDSTWLLKVRMLLGLSIMVFGAGRAVCVPRGDNVPSGLVGPVLLVLVGVLIMDGGWGPAVGASALAIGLAWIGGRRTPASSESS